MVVVMDGGGRRVKNSQVQLETNMYNLSQVTRAGTDNDNQ